MVKNPIWFFEGDHVMVSNNMSGSKFEPKFKGPHEIIKNVKDPPNFQLSRIPVKCF